MENKYDIFISYRRADVGAKAEHLKDLLEPYYKDRISFDRENITGQFNVKLVSRIDKCKDFIIVIGKDSFHYQENDFDEESVNLYRYLASCSVDDFKKKIEELGDNAHIDYVRIEIARALNRKDINIIPVVPETTDKFRFSSIPLPTDIVNIKHYEAVSYSESQDSLFKTIIPGLRLRLISRPDSLLKKFMFFIIPVIIVAAIFGGIRWNETNNLNNEIERLKDSINVEGLRVQWPEDISLKQIHAIRDILSHMQFAKGGKFMMGAAQNADGSYDEEVCIRLETPQIEQEVGSFWISSYELTEGEWCGIMGTQCSLDSMLYPKVNISFDDCKDFVERLRDITKLDFAIPTEAEWEYAARGGINNDSTIYAGSNDINKVGWYGGNSNNELHISDARNYDIYCNKLNLFYMSGNVGEWCDTPFRLYSDVATQNPYPQIIHKEAMVVRGGNFLSDSFELTVYHRDPMNAHECSRNIGMRLIIRK